MHFPRPLRPSLKWILAVAMLAIATPQIAQAEALLVVEADTGKVLQADNATMPWYPASLSKLMTAYVTLKAVKDGRVSLDTLLTVSPNAASQSPSKMGFRPGTQVTVDNALKMMLVKSANDMAVVLAEGIGGSIDGFAGEMNQTASRLGMTQTSYVNPNGLPADGQITSARDMAILARAIIRDLPEYEYFVHIPSIRFGRRITQNFNKLIGRYPGADGFKTGFICASGYNLVASATRDGKRLIAVVLGASSGRMRAIRAAQLLDRGFANNGLAWLRPSLGTVDNLVPIDSTPPNLREEMCGAKHKRPASDEDGEDTVASAGASTNGDSGVSFFASGLQAAMPTKPADMLAQPAAASEPVVVYTGPTKTGAALIAAVDADTEKMQPVKRAKGKHTRVAGKKPDAADDAKGDAKNASKSDSKSDNKPAAKPVRHANAKPDAAAAKPAADKPAAAKPAGKPAAAAKPAAKPKAEKPKADAKPAG
ncbi:D-alanyl-D-alanine carboxypeptidase family protein [Bradyrhizobium sp. CCBAU 53421]|uniref:D-alanyl-D-alanine carboxypeptidase family protein n=1 Tax=Bradyrhizobium sp. CCBAU 53421 TaxID=1325120 RepID=UPI00188B64CD|nr:D-alanyl-D-alanine carboxypeptidase family protein [Bradyrhizobium sp. CCBAU 53421]QOZ31234.1 peptidase M15 [Bradyrhizobium sp. CCBAU 53421]